LAFRDAIKIDAKRRDLKTPEARGERRFFRSARALDFELVNRIARRYRLRPSRNAQIARPWASAAAMNIPVAAPPASNSPGS
jgi:hypothetical protein